MALWGFPLTSAPTTVLSLCQKNKTPNLVEPLTLGIITSS
jgi:hypothetical protein